MLDTRRSSIVHRLILLTAALASAAWFCSVAVAAGTALCGDGVVQDGELCDDGNDSDLDTCKTDCTYNWCGDGFAGGPDESCDDGNQINGDGCDSNCQPTRCGNGARSPGEECDTASYTYDGGCLPDCTLNRCGDGFVLSDTWNGVYHLELCDDGNLIDADGCDSTCRPTGCGSGIVTGKERCDDGNDSNYDACRTNCKPNVCGDGYVNAGVEECDDGNQKHDDGCSPDCVLDGECADANRDGRITVGDAQHVLMRATRLVSDCPLAMCDVNADGFVDTSDSLGTLRFAIGLHDQGICERPTRIVFRLEDAVSLGALQFQLGYGALPGYFEGERQAVECTALTNAYTVFSNDPAQAVLSVGMIDIVGFTGPVDLGSCIFMRYGPRSPLELNPIVEDAAAPDITWLPDVRVAAEEH